MRTPVNRPGQGGADGPGVDAVGVVEGVPDMGVQAVGLLEELGRPPGVAVGDRGLRQGVEGEDLGLEVALVARLVEHGVEVLDGGLGYVLITLAVTRAIAPRWMTYLGYVAWCLWLIAMAVVLWRARADQGVLRPARV